MMQIVQNGPAVQYQEKCLESNDLYTFDKPEFVHKVRLYENRVNKMRCDCGKCVWGGGVDRRFQALDGTTISNYEKMIEGKATHAR